MANAREVFIFMLLGELVSYTQHTECISNSSHWVIKTFLNLASIWRRCVCESLILNIKLSIVTRLPQLYIHGILHAYIYIAPTPGTTTLLLSAVALDIGAQEDRWTTANTIYTCVFKVKTLCVCVVGSCGLERVLSIKATKCVELREFLWFD